MIDQRNIKSISARHLHDLGQQRPIELIDVRTADEFRDVHAANARNVPLGTFEPEAILKSRQAPPGEPIYFICEVGVRSAHACAMMIAAGFPDVVNVEGGTQAWMAAGLPVGYGG